jgi:hypothetical protein
VVRFGIEIKRFQPSILGPAPEPPIVRRHERRIERMHAVQSLLAALASLSAMYSASSPILGAFDEH